MPAELIGNPLAGFSPVIEVEHRSHGIHTQPVDADFGPIVVENPAVPIGMIAAARVGVVVQVRAIE